MDDSAPSVLPIPPAMSLQDALAVLQATQMRGKRKPEPKASLYSEAQRVVDAHVEGMIR